MEPFWGVQLNSLLHPLSLHPAWCGWRMEHSSLVMVLGLWSIPLTLHLWHQIGQQIELWALFVSSTSVRLMLECTSVCSMTLHPREERWSPLDHTKWTQVYLLINIPLILDHAFPFSWVTLGPIYLNGISPPVVTLCPPDPLVIQVEAGGEYAGIQWTGTPIALNVSNGELVDFQQTFVRNVTSRDWGLYTVSLILPSNSTCNITVSKTFHITTLGK